MYATGRLFQSYEHLVDRVVLARGTVKLIRADALVQAADALVTVGLLEMVVGKIGACECLNEWTARDSVRRGGNR